MCESVVVGVIMLMVRVSVHMLWLEVVSVVAVVSLGGRGGSFTGLIGCKKPSRTGPLGERRGLRDGAVGSFGSMRFRGFRNHDKMWLQVITIDGIERTIHQWGSEVLSKHPQVQGGRKTVQINQ